MRTYVESIARAMHRDVRAKGHAARGARPRRARSTFVASEIDGTFTLRLAH